MTHETLARLRAMLRQHAERVARLHPPEKPLSDETERRRRECGERLQHIALPVLQAVTAELRSAGHEASVRDFSDTSDSYPSVALAFAPRVPGANPLASVLILRCDPRRGVAVQRDIKPAKGRIVTGTHDRHGTMKVDALSVEWVESKTLSFVEAVLKAT